MSETPIEPPSPARLYASATGALLVVLGILGFFYSASFGSPGEVDDMLGVFAVNGWLNVIHIALGAVGLLVAGFASRSYSLWLGLLLIVLSAWGFIVGSGDAILGFIPADVGDNLLHLVLGMLGLAAAAATPRRAARATGVSTTSRSAPAPKERTAKSPDS
ncbi:MAG TPA: DUF4383 domain-containing protein [Solirubrobacterales bacterium]|jgi:hypothetical protein